MSRYLLDTNVVSEPLAAAPNNNILAALERNSGACVIAAPVLHELRFGVARLARSRRRAQIERYIDEVVLRLFPVLPYDQEAAEWHAHERARLAKAGKPAPFVDGVIASIASVSASILVTANVRDFRVFKDLRVEDWSR